MHSEMVGWRVLAPSGDPAQPCIDRTDSES